jgi:electron transfer flavoprotein alpha subunit
MLNILVFTEQRNGAIRKSSLETLCEARRQADKAQGKVVAVLAGKDIKSLVATLSQYKPDKVLTFDSVEADNYSTEVYAAFLEAAIKKEEPNYIFSAATGMAKDLIPRVAARVDAACVSDVVEIKNEAGSLSVIKPIYSGKVLGWFELTAKIGFVTLRPNAFWLNDPDKSFQTQVEELAVTIGLTRAKVTETHISEAGKVELSEARIVVSGGRGIKGPEHWGMLQDLCDVLGAALGASRAVVDAGWIDHQHQVGQTGKTVSPQLYIACGISGAVQHLAGMSSSKVIVAINKDAQAPIFKYATYGVVGDIFEIIPKLTEECKKLIAQ